jgi:SAM-dependent methyltransferase
MSPVEHDRMRAVEDDYWWYQALRKEVACLMHPKRPRFSALDAGCGSGGMLAALALRFSSAVLVGIDLSEHALALTARRATGATLVPGSVNQLPLPNSQFDFVLSLDVLTNRGVDERAALREAYRVLRSGGELIVNVAAFDFLHGSHDVAVDADRRYTRPQLAASLREAGFCIRRLTYWNMSLLPVIALMRWRSRKTPRAEAKSDFAPLLTGLNVALARLMRLEFALSSLVPLPFGTSLLALARKP